MNGTLAPKDLATPAISASSVETITSSKSPLSKAASIEYAMMGLPQNSLMFLRGIRLDPPRAVITQTALDVPLIPGHPLDAYGAAAPHAPTPGARGAGRPEQQPHDQHRPLQPARTFSTARTTPSASTSLMEQCRGSVTACS